MQVPHYLYKILSIEAWQASLERPCVQLSPMDDHFVHLATLEQVDRICQKFWSHAREVILLKLDPSRLKGRLVLEKNPGGSTAYYHLYEGSIPHQAVVQASRHQTPHFARSP